MSFKRTKVVMLPTNEKAPLILGTSKNGKLAISNSSICNGVYVQNQHLHFLSDDEIKEGDLVLLTNNSIVKAVVGKLDLDTIIGFNTGKGNVVKHFSKTDKKIIATTDSSLLFGGPKSKEWVYLPLPKPSEGFIQKFVDSYNSGKPITEVDVEYEKIKQALSVIPKKTKNGTDYTEVEWEFQETLKVNLKDNTITIKKVKDSWSREEVIELILQSNLESHSTNHGFDIIYWIQENL